MAGDSTTIELSRSEVREVAGYAVACARPALAIFERERPDDRRPRAAIDAAQAFAAGAERTKALGQRMGGTSCGSGGPRCRTGCCERRCARGRPCGRCGVPPPAAESYSGQTHPRIRCSCRTSLRTPRRRRSHRRSRPHRAVTDPCASRRGGHPEALPGRPAWRWAGRRTDPSVGRVAPVIPDGVLMDEFYRP